MLNNLLFFPHASVRKTYILNLDMETLYKIVSPLGKGHDFIRRAKMVI